MTDDPQAHFHGNAAKLVMQIERDVKAWLGALQFAAYSLPDRVGKMPKQDAAGEGVLPAHHSIRVSPDIWYEGMRSAIEGAVKNAQNALANEWQKRKDPRHASDEARDAFAHSMEHNFAQIVHAVLEAGDAVEHGVVPRNHQLNVAYEAVRKDLRKIVALYQDHCYEMTFTNRTDSLLALLPRIHAGDSRAM